MIKAEIQSIIDEIDKTKANKPTLSNSEIVELMKIDATKENAKATRELNDQLKRFINIWQIKAR